MKMYQARGSAAVYKAEEKMPGDALSGKAPFVASGSENFGFFPQHGVDKPIHVVIDLGAEHWALRRRLMILEKSLEAAGALSEDALELVEPSAEDLAV